MVYDISNPTPQSFDEMSKAFKAVNPSITDQQLRDNYTALGGTPPVIPTITAPSTGPTDSTTQTVSPHYSRYDKSIADTNTALDATTGTAPDQAKILADKKAAADAMIATIQTEFQKSLTSENAAGADRLARTRALQVTSGGTGSNFATGEINRTEDKNKQAVDLLTNANNAKINEILSGVDTRASDQYKQELAAYRASLEGDLTRQTQLKDQMRKQALDSFTGLASSGITLDQLKTQEPDTYAHLKDEFGGSDLSFKAAYNAALPDNLKVQYNTQVIKGDNGNAIIHRYGIDPVKAKTDPTHALITENFDTGQNFDKFNQTSGDIKEMNGTIYRVSKDGSTLTKLETTPLAQSQIDKNNNAMGINGPTGTGIKTVNWIKANLTDTTPDPSGYSVKGADGFTDPGSYEKAMQYWIAQKGSIDNFVRNFPPKDYINPESQQQIQDTIENNTGA